MIIESKFQIDNQCGFLPGTTIARDRMRIIAVRRRLLQYKGQKRMTVKAPTPGRHFGCIEFVRGRNLVPTTNLDSQDQSGEHLMVHR